MTDATELRAWRFLAAHRVGDLHATHVTFIDSGADCRLNTPSFGEYYESAKGATFGEAAIELAIALGMPCTDSAVEQSDSDRAENSAGTAVNGGSESSTPATPAALEGSTTAATGAERSTETAPGKGRRGKGANLAHSFQSALPSRKP